jgi:hypothetical protein
VTIISLAQPGLDKLLRATGKAPGFERLLAKGCGGNGTTRAIANSPEETNYLGQLITFTIHKERRPKE